jgi:hypothetical protein
VIAVLLDTDVLIEVFRERDAEVAMRWRQCTKNDTFLAYSPVTEAEIFQAIHDDERPGVVEILDALICVPIDCHIGRMAGEYLRVYQKSHSLEMPDALIAATAAMGNLRLWTRNRRHFPMKDVHFFG